VSERYTNWILKHRWSVLILSVLAVLILISGARLLKFDNDYRAFFDGSNPHLQAFEELQATYTKNDNVLMVLAPKDKNVFTPATLKAVKDATEKAWQTPYSLRVDSLTNFQHTHSEGDDLTVEDLVDDPDSLSPTDLEKIKNIALHEPLLVHRLISPQAHVTAINITVELPGKTQNEVPDVAASVRELAHYIETTYPDIKVYLSGIVMMNNAFPEASKYDMTHLTPLSYLVILIVLLIMLRSFSGIITTLLLLSLSIMAAMGFAGWVGYPLTSPLFSVPVIVMTLGVADSVHILSNWRQEILRGRDKVSAMAESLRINTGPIFLTSITTAVGFMSLNFSDAPPFRALGNVAAVGVMIAWFLSMTLLPVMMTLLPTRIKPHPSDKKEQMKWVSDLVINQRKPLLWGLSLLILGLLAFIPKNELNDVFVKYFDKRVEFRTDTDFVVNNLTGVYFIDFSLDSGDKGVSDPKFQQDVEKLAQWLRTQPEVLHVNTITDIMKRLNKNMHGDDPAWYKLPEDKNLAAQYLLLYEMSLPYGLDLNNQIDINKQSTRLSATLKTIDTERFLELEQRIHDWMKTNTPDILTYGSSPGVMFANIGHMNIRSMLKGTVIALVVISLLLIIALRSVRYGLLSLIPNLVPAGMAFGLWGIINGNVGLSLSVVAAMTLGIVVDDTVHFMSKYLRAKREKGLQAEAAIHYAFSTVGIALVVTSVALVAGFLVLATSSFQLNSSMGVMVSIVISFALLVDFLFLPPLMLTLDKWLNGHKSH